MEHAPPDPRLPVLGNFVQKTLKLKAEKWTRLLATEDLRKCVLDFLDKPDNMTLIVMQVRLTRRDAARVRTSTPALQP